MSTIQFTTHGNLKQKKNRPLASKNKNMISQWKYISSLYSGYKKKKTVINISKLNFFIHCNWLLRLAIKVNLIVTNILEYLFQRELQLKFVALLIHRCLSWLGKQTNPFTMRTRFIHKPIFHLLHANWMS